MTAAQRARRSAGIALAVVALFAGACTDGPDPLAADPGGRGHTGSGAHGAHEMAPPAGAASPARHTGPQGRVGQFVTDCAYSHSAPDDPIVHPGRPGRSHRHDFFGNTTTDAHSTPATLLDRPTTCQKRLDTAAYWAPSLLDGGEPVTPTMSTAYYRPAPGVDPTSVQAYPAGLMVVAGDMTATATAPQSPDLAGWTCGASPRNHTTPPRCPASAPLRAMVTFPDCWDGRRTDSADHRSHMANSSDGACPATHPVHVPQLTFVIDYPVWGEGHDLSLASGELEGIHSDFVNSWHQDGLEQEVAMCIRRGLVCGLSSNRDEEALFTG